MKVFLTGASGYMGRRLAPELLRRGHQVVALVRETSQPPEGCEVVIGDALNASTYRDRVPKGSTFVHLVGVAHPGPAKGAHFRAIDLVSIQAAVEAAKFAQVAHFVYVSVAHPAPVMKDYIAVRKEGESLLKSSGLNATILRPWYVLGPGHWWPILIKPFYWLMKRESAERLGLVTLTQMTNALADAVDHPAHGVRVVEVPEIRR